MSKFKEQLRRDIQKVFLNTNEFAERRTIRYDGEEYADIPVSLQSLEGTDRQRLSINGFGFGHTDGAPGLHQISGILFCAMSDLGGRLPKQGQPIQISSRQGGAFFQTYFLGLVGCEMGMLRMELERSGE